MKQLCQNLLLALVSTLFFIALGEGLARLRYSPEQLVYTGLFEYDRDKVYALRRNLTGASFAGSLVSTNSFGHRDREIPVEKPPRGFRVLAIGDSVTFGHGVRAEQTWPEALERQLAARFPELRVEVVNTAVPGNSPFQEYHDLRRALVFEPDAVVIQFVLNDLVEPYNVFRRYGGRGHDYHSVEDVPWWNHELSQRSALYLLLEDVVTRLRLGAITLAGMREKALRLDAELSWNAAADAPLDPRIREAWRECLAWIEKEVELCRERGIPVVLLVTPVNFQFLDGSRTYAQRRLAGFADEHRIGFVDLLSVLRARAVKQIVARRPADVGLSAGVLAKRHPRQWAAIWGRYYLDYDHLRPKGHGLVAETLLDLISPATRRSEPRTLPGPGG